MLTYQSTCKHISFTQDRLDPLSTSPSLHLHKFVVILPPLLSWMQHRHRLPPLLKSYWGHPRTEPGDHRPSRQRTLLVNLSFTNPLPHYDRQDLRSLNLKVPELFTSTEYFSNHIPGPHVLFLNWTTMSQPSEVIQSSFNLYITFSILLLSNQSHLGNNKIFKCVRDQMCYPYKRVSDTLGLKLYN